MFVSFSKMKRPKRKPPFHYDRAVLAKLDFGDPWVKVGTMRTHVGTPDHPARAPSIRNWMIEVFLDGFGETYARTIFEPPAGWVRPGWYGGVYWTDFEGLKISAYQWVRQTLERRGWEPSLLARLHGERSQLLKEHAGMVDKLKRINLARADLDLRIMLAQDRESWVRNQAVLRMGGVDPKGDG